MCESTTTLSPEKNRLLVARMAEAATDWLAALAPEQRQKAVFEFSAKDERVIWYYTPTERGGLPLVEMDPIQQRLAHRLIASGLSNPGYNAAAAIMGLENILDAREGWKTTYSGRNVPNRGRDPLLYFVSVFGDPNGKTWGWRVGGHHVSFSHTIVNGLLATPTPLFFGSNPAMARFVGPGRLRPLAGEEDIARDLLQGLNPDQLNLALLSPIAPTDIVQANRPFIEPGAVPRPGAAIPVHKASDDVVRRLLDSQPHRPNSSSEDVQSVLRYEEAAKGLSASQMTTDQRVTLTALIRQYVDRLPEELAEIHAARLTGETLDATHFAWAGGGEPGDPHYYRIQGPRLLIEYDNTQNDANHIHAVWRDPEGDFGVDLLAEHYRMAH